MKRVQFLRRTQIDGQFYHAGQIVEMPDTFVIPKVTERTGEFNHIAGFMSEVLTDTPVAIVLGPED